MKVRAVMISRYTQLGELLCTVTYLLGMDILMIRECICMTLLTQKYYVFVVAYK